MELPEAVELLALSNLYQFDKLKQDLSVLIEHHMNITNCCLIFQHAHYNLAIELKNVSLRFIIKNFEVVKTTPGYAELEDELVATIFQTQEELAVQNQSSDLDVMFHE
jgi:hypothetical protein